MNVRNSISMQDRMSPVMKTILGTMDTMISTMERVDRTTKTVGKADWSHLRSELSYANRQFEQMEEEINNINNAQNKVKRGFGGWAGVVTGINQGYQLMRSIAGGVGNIMGKSDTLTLTNARLGLINDGLRTQRQLQDEIYAAADRSRAKYEDIADLVSKVTMNAPGVFADNMQAIGFAETFNKLLKVSGAESSEASAATLQLTQALASGRLQGDEFRSIRESAPMLRNLIADAMGVSAGQLAELSSQGAITAEVMVKAMSEGSEKIEAMFANIPMTFGDRMTSISNIVGRRLNQIANSGAFDVILDKLRQFDMWLRSSEGERATRIIAGTFIVISNTVGLIVSGIGSFINLIVGVPGVLETILGLITAIAIVTAIQMASAIWKAVVALGTQVKMEWMHIWAILTKRASIIKTNASIWAQAAAWLAVNWVLLLVVGVVIGLLVTMLKFPEVLGFLMGMFARFGAFVFNIYAFMHNIFSLLAEFLANFLNEPLYSSKRALVNFANTVLDIVKYIARAIDGVFGSKLSSAIVSLQGKIGNWLGEMPEGYKTWHRLEYMDPLEATSWGKSKGTEWATSMASGLNNMKDKFFNFDGEGLGGFGDFSDNLNIAGGNIDKVGKIGGEVNIAKEDLKYLLDTSTRQFVNRIKVEQVAPVDVNINVSGGSTEDDAVKIADTLKRVLSDQSAGAVVSVN